MPESRVHLLTRRRAMAVLLLGLLLLLIFSPAFQFRVDKAADWTLRFAETEPLWGAAIFVVISAISAMMAFFSNAVLVPTAVLVWGKLGTFLLLWSGWTLGAAVAYGVGLTAAPLLERLGYEKKMEKYRQEVSERMSIWHATLFCLAVPSEVPGYLFGSARYSFLKFLAAMGAAEALYAGLLVFLGQQASVLRPSIVLLAAGVLTIIIIASLFIAKKRPAVKS